MKSLTLVILMIFPLLMLPIVTAEPISVMSPFGSPLAGARVQAIKLDGTVIEGYLDSEGRISIRDVPLGVITLRVISWRGFSIDYEVVITMYNTSVTCYTIGRLAIVAKTVLGQPLRMAYVEIVSEDGVKEELVLKNGKLNVELPAGKYSITVSIANRQVTREVEITGGRTVFVDVTLPVIEIFGSIVDQWYPLYMTIVLLIVIVILVIGVYELTIYLRTRRLKKIVEKVSR